MGTRLREETEYRPKPMVNIGGKPILWHIMKIYAHYGFKDFILCLGYKGEVIKRYFYDYKILNNDFTIKFGKHKYVEIHDRSQNEDWRITLSDTGDKALKGARIKRVERYVDDDQFMLTYGDGVADINLQKLLSFHKSHGRIGTVTGVGPPSRFGEMTINSNHRVTSFTEKPQTSNGLINGGFFVFSHKFFNYLSDSDDCDFEAGPLQQLAKEGELMVYPHEGSWACMDTYRDMIYLNNEWETGKPFWRIWKE